jgi:hypothetical protein
VHRPIQAAGGNTQYPNQALYAAADADATETASDERWRQIWANDADEHYTNDVERTYGPTLAHWCAQLQSVFTQWEARNEPGPLPAMTAL